MESVVDVERRLECERCVFELVARRKSLGIADQTSEGWKSISIETIRILRALLINTHFSVVNLFSLYADMNCGDSLNALRLNEPWELRLTSCTRATVLSFRSF